MMILKEKQATPRIMIIVWKWEKSISEPGSGTWRVSHPENNEAYGADCIYCIRDTTPFKTREVEIQKLIEACDANAPIYVFLHRRAGYSGNEVSKILDHFINPPNGISRNIKCFLFSDGRDYIYTGINKKGLLADTDHSQEGTFGGSSGGEAADVVLNWEKRLINYSRFEDVWEYYTHYFKAKIFDLKEDLLLHLCHFYTRNKPVFVSDFFDLLSEHEILYLRTKAFSVGLDKEDHKKVKAIENLLDERIELMDDCLPNLQKVYGDPIKDLYMVLKADLERHLVTPDYFDTTEFDAGEVLRTLRSHFRQLLSDMPEETYY